MLKWMIKEGYGDVRTLSRRIKEMKNWLDAPELLEADADAEYAAVIDIDLNAIKEPIVACPNDPDDVKILSEVAGKKIDEVFIGSCMTGISHFRHAAEILNNKKNLPARLWMTPPTRIDAQQLKNDGLFSIFGTAGARLETPGCSLCMGNQARVADGATVVSTSTRNFPNRLGDDTRVYLGSAQLAAICAIEGKIPTLKEYQRYITEK